MKYTTLGSVLHTRSHTHTHAKAIFFFKEIAFLKQFTVWNFTVCITSIFNEKWVQDVLRDDPHMLHDDALARAGVVFHMQALFIAYLLGKPDINNQHILIIQSYTMLSF